MKTLQLTIRYKLLIVEHLGRKKYIFPKIKVHHQKGRTTLLYIITYIVFTLKLKIA
jgi:hypothetical protein